MFVEDKKRKERLAICESCDMNMFGMCTECGCVIVLKTMLKDSSCPIGKWSSEDFTNEKTDI